MDLRCSRHVLGGLILAVAGAAALDAEESPASKAMPSAARPNIILIVADDLGYGELGCYGGKEIPTPNLDTLARNGVRFTSGYVSCPVCSPTRAGLITGRYQQRFGHEFNPGAAVLREGVEFGLPLSEVTLAERLQAAGYATGMVGKWHLGPGEKYHPLRRGFQEYFGFLGGAHPYLPAATAAKKKAAQRQDVFRGFDPVRETEYLTDAFTREAVAYVKAHKDRPFFLYLTYNAVHSPLQAIEKYSSRFAGINDARRRTFAAMLSALDDGVGAVLGALREAAIEEKTLVFFISDNGGPTPLTTSGNGPFRGYKAQALEGGIRVPFLVQWKGRLPAGKTYDASVISLDIVPTALAAAGVSLAADAKIDGVDLLPHLTGKTEKPPHEALFWRFGQWSAIRKGPWKLLKERGAWRLFDLSSDLGEAKDLAAEKKDLVAEMKGELERWEAQLAEPLWGRNVQTAGPKQKAARKKQAVPGETAAPKAQ